MFFWCRVAALLPDRKPHPKNFSEEKRFSAMPIYEHKCPKCNHVFEEWARSAEASPEAACPLCSTASPRIISRTSFVLKGDGWYVSDYGYRKGITEDSASSGKTPAKATTTTPAVQTDKTIAKNDSATKGAAKPAASTPTAS